MIRLADCTYLEAGRLARDPSTVVVLPLGAIEEHGPHLPLLVDWLGAEEIARRLIPYLRRAGFRPLLAPSIPYGVSTLAEDWSGTVSLSIATFRRLLVEVVSGLARAGFRRFVLANYQADPDHLRAMALARRALERRARVQVLYAGFGPGRVPSPTMVNRRVTALLRSPRPELEWHSGELETSVVLATRPRLVRAALARRLAPAWIDYRAALVAGVRSFRQMSPGGRGYFGSPAAARARTGRAALALRTRLIATQLIAELRAWRPPARPPAARRRSRPRAGGRARPC